MMKKNFEAEVNNNKWISIFLKIWPFLSHKNKFFSQQVRTIFKTKHQFFNNKIPVHCETYLATYHQANKAKMM